MPITIRLEDVRDHLAFRHKLQRKSDGSLRPLADITWTIGGREVEVSAGLYLRTGRNTKGNDMTDGPCRDKQLPAAVMNLQRALGEVLDVIGDLEGEMGGILLPDSPPASAPGETSPPPAIGRCELAEKIIEQFERAMTAHARLKRLHERLDA